MAEFQIEHMGKIYKQIDYMGKNISITGEPQYVDKCVKLLNDWVWSSYVGQAILQETFAAPKNLSIYIDASGLVNPHVDFNGNANPLDAYAAGPSPPPLPPLPPSSTGPNCYRHNPDPTPKLANPPRQFDESYEPGTGRGANPIMNLDKNLTLRDTSMSFVCGPTGKKCENVNFYRPEFVLMHEIVHANRAMRGIQKKRIVPQDHQSDTEEQVAIIITNMLMSEKGGGPLRKNHQTNETLASPDPKPFVTNVDHYGLVKRIADSHPVLKARMNIKTCPVWFNPIYEIYRGNAQPLDHGKIMDEYVSSEGQRRRF